MKDHKRKCGLYNDFYSFMMFTNSIVISCFRAAEDMQQYSSECIPLSHDTLEDAIQWMWNLDRLAAVSNTACTEAILKAVADNFVSISATHECVC